MTRQVTSDEYTEAKRDRKWEKQENLSNLSNPNKQEAFLSFNNSCTLGSKSNIIYSSLFSRLLSKNPSTARQLPVIFDCPWLYPRLFFQMTTLSRFHDAIHILLDTTPTTSHVSLLQPHQSPRRQIQLVLYNQDDMICHHHTQYPPKAKQGRRQKIWGRGI